MHKEVVRWGWSSVVALCKAISFTQRVFCILVKASRMLLHGMYTPYATLICLSSLKMDPSICMLC